jgi:hypothetical protein
MVLMVKPKSLSVMMETNNESGIAMREMMVVLKFIKNRNIIITTKIEPSISAFWMLFIDA